ncbi:MAG: sulfate ABC transporter permease subunit CysT [Candidatus Latescibacteria bacterium]|nr:sulfate ABC transporter permease subunit CysT [Candidatus Latescibacterota bacterium]
MKRGRTRRRVGVLPGFGPTLGITVFMVSVVVVIPLMGLFVRSAGLGFGGVWETVTTPRVLAAFRLSFGASLIAATINAVIGFLVAWTLVRYEFPGKRVVDALVDLPFALPTAVSGIALTALFAPQGWVGRLLAPLGLPVAFTPLGVTVALVFIGLPFVVRTLQPALMDLDAEVEEAAAVLGAGRLQILSKVIVPTVLPALLTGTTLAFARAVGEYGSVVFISGNMPNKTEIVPLLIVAKLEQYDFAGATAIGAVMLVLSFAILLAVNLLQGWTGRYREGN